MQPPVNHHVPSATATASRRTSTSARSEARPARTGLVAPFVGRGEQLAAFREALEGDAAAARIVCIHGTPGAGRSRFGGEAVAALRAEGQSLIVLSPEPGDLVDLPSLLGAFSSQLPSAGAALSRAVSRAAETGLESKSAAKLVLTAIFQEIYNCPPDRRSCLRPMGKRVVFAIDDFDTCAPGLQLWFGQELLPQLMELRSHLDFLLLVMTDAPLSGQLQPFAWNAQPARLVEIEIPRMSQDESIQLLTSFGRRPEEAQICYELGEGLPGAMLGLLRHSLRPAHEIAEALRQCSGPVADLLIAIAKLGVATPEGLRLSLGSDEAAPWIDRGMPDNLPVPLVGYLQAEGVSLPGPIARLVEQHLGGRTAATARRATEAAQTLAALAELFPSDQARRRAAQLAVFRFFDEHALRTCFGGEAGSFLELIRTHERSFPQSSGRRWRLGDEAAGHLRRYAAALGHLDLAGLRAKAEAAWFERQAEHQRVLEESAANLKKLTRDRDSVLKEIGEARANVAAAERDRHTARTSRLSGDAWRVGASLLINGAGVACLWAALFTAGNRASFVVLGALLILFGLCTPALSRRQGSAEAEVRRRNTESQHRLERAQGALEFTETRYASIQKRLAEERRREDDARAALEEPYVG